MVKKKAVKRTPAKARSPSTKCGVNPTVVKKYGICDVACTPVKRKKCDYHKKKVKKK